MSTAVETETAGPPATDPAVAQRDPEVGRGALGRGHGGALHDALHGGGRAPLRPDRHSRRRAYDAFAQIQRHEGTLADILPELGALAAMAVVLLAHGTWALRRSTARAL